MSEMVKRVQEAIEDALDRTGTVLLHNGEVAARAAIEAMREYGHEVGTRRMWQELFPPPPEMSA